MKRFGLDSPHTLVRGGRVLTFDEGTPDLDRGDVLITDGVISEVGPEITPPEGCRSIDATGTTVMPGFVDAHSHLWEQSLRNTGLDWTIPDYHRVLRGSFGDHYRPDDVYVGTLLGCIDAISSGVTTVVDCAHLMNSPEHADAGVQALRDSGIRAVFAYGSANHHWLPSGAGSPLSDDAIRVHSDHFADKGGRVSMALCSRGALARSDPSIPQRDVALARDLGVPITLTGGMAYQEGDDSDIARLDALGLVDDRVLFYHSSALSPSDLDLLQARGAGIAYTPENELRAGYALPMIADLLDRGIPVGVGFDTPILGGDYFNALRATLAGEGIRQHLDSLDGTTMPDKVRLSVTDALRVATAGGARACWLDDTVGRLAPGLAADLILVDEAELSIFPGYNPAGSIVFNGSARAVRTVMVEGRLVKLDGRIVGVDHALLVQRARESRAALFAAAGYDQAECTFAPG